MTRLTRITNKVFGATASIADDPLYGPQIGQFGSAKAGTYNATADVATIQGLSAWNNGWIDAVIPNQQYPTLPEMTGFGKVVTYQTGYILQEGVPEWDAGTTYYKESIVKVVPVTISRSATASIGESTGITSASVDLATFITQITIDGTYVFTFDGSYWTYEGISTNLATYGITYEGTPAEDDTITISLTTIENRGELTLYVSTQDENINHEPATSPSYWRLLQLGGGKNIGETVFSLLPLTDSGLHLLDGSLIVGGSYAQFINYMENLYNNNPTANYFCSEGDWQTTVTTYGACGKFVVDTVNHTVRIPKLTGMIEGTIDVNALGDLIEAGLPNIVGTFWGDNGSAATGAFHFTGQTQNYISGGEIGGEIEFNASSYNSIYKNGSKVQPQTIKGFFYLCIANVTKTDVEVDIDEIVTDLNGKADVDLTNTNPSQTFIDTTMDWSMPDYSSMIDISSSVDMSSTQDRSYSYPIMIYFMAVNSSIIANTIIVEINGVTYINCNNSYSGCPTILTIPANTNFKVYVANGMPDINKIVRIIPMKGA